MGNEILITITKIF